MSAGVNSVFWDSLCIWCKCMLLSHLVTLFSQPAAPSQHFRSSLANMGTNFNMLNRRKPQAAAPCWTSSSRAMPQQAETASRCRSCCDAPHHVSVSPEAMLVTRTHMLSHVQQRTACILGRRAPVALAGRRGPIVKHVPNVALAAVAAHLRAAGTCTLRYHPAHPCLHKLSSCQVSAAST